jgi:hypothetical protein
MTVDGPKHGQTSARGGQPFVRGEAGEEKQMPVNGRQKTAGEPRNRKSIMEGTKKRPKKPVDKGSFAGIFNKILIP